MMDINLSRTSAGMVMTAILCTALNRLWKRCCATSSELIGIRPETYEALKIYIQMDMDGLQDSVVQNACR